MERRSAIEATVTVVLDRGSSIPLHRQLYEGLRAAILGGRLRAGTRLPSTRALALELHVSRNTVMGAFLQLLAEGYLEARVGSGTYVADSLPESMLRATARVDRGEESAGDGRALSRRGEEIASARASTSRDRGVPRAFRTGVPALEEFPSRVWGRLAGRIWRNPPRGLLGYGDPAGYRPLREEIAAYLEAARAVRCEWEQVIVVSGSQQALDLAARVLLDPGDAAWVEDPGYAGARGALISAGAHIVPVPVDGEGLEISAGVERAVEARLAYVSPSHQYPLGATMSLSRRLELLAWASRAGSWVLEDDYDSEYRYTGRPLEALQGLDTEGRVIYLGTFSKVLSPALRLGYLVVPPDLVGPFTAARELADRHSPLVEQAVLARFIAEGCFARHIRRMRVLYAERQAALVEAAARDLQGLLDVRGAEAGMHLVGWLPEGADDREAANRAAAKGVEATALSCYGIEPLHRGGLLLGYSAVGEDEIRAGVRRLEAALRELS
jgi:GntR family transcriptional regulator/MocR family aminotransferase